MAALTAFGREWEKLETTTKDDKIYIVRGEDDIFPLYPENNDWNTCQGTWKLVSFLGYDLFFNPTAGELYLISEDKAYYTYS